MKYGLADVKYGLADVKCGCDRSLLTIFGSFKIQDGIKMGKHSTLRVRSSCKAFWMSILSENKREDHAEAENTKHEISSNTWHSLMEGKFCNS